MCSRVCKDEACKLHPERDRKGAYRLKIKGKKDGRKHGVKKRRERLVEMRQETRKLQIDVRSLVNEKRRWKQKNESLCKILNESLENSRHEDEVQEHEEGEDKEDEDEEEVMILSTPTTSTELLNVAQIEKENVPHVITTK